MRVWGEEEREELTLPKRITEVASTYCRRTMGPHKNKISPLSESSERGSGTQLGGTGLASASVADRYIVRPLPARR